MNTKEKLEKIKKGEMSAEENVKQFLEVIKEKNKKYNAFLYVDKEGALERAKEVDKKKKKGKLAGLAVGVKANINVKGMPISCASKTLEDYKGSFDADVIKRIKKEDGVIIGVLNMDEFACGYSGLTSAFGKTINPAAEERIPGGSSSGAGAAVAAGMCDIALGSDTGGSIRSPASHCGVVGVKASYGRVSRYGLIDLSMSLDQIGPLCKDVYGAALMMEVISGYSDNDPTTYEEEVDDYSNFGEIKKLKIGLSPAFEKLCENKKIYNLVEEKAKELAEKINSKVKEINLKHVDLAVQTYYPIVYTEFFSGTRKFDGRKYGKKIEDSCGEEVLRRILGGREISRAEHEGAYYRKALAAKKLIENDFKKAFEKVDVIIAPVTPSLPHKIDEELSLKESYAGDAFTIPANLAGVCSGVLKGGEIDGIPVGLQVMAPAFKEKRMFKVMKAVEELK